MTVLLIGADQLGNIPKELEEEYGCMEIIHWSGRKAQTKKKCIPAKVEMELVFHDFVSHGLMDIVKDQAKRRRLPIIFSRRGTSDHARKDLYLKTISALTSAVDAKDVYTQNHSRRVAELSVALARDLQLAEEEVENIRYGAILHDIGKIGVEEGILNKVEKLAKDEFELIKAHPLIGAKILEPIDFLTEALDIVRHHHERFDGTGYPEGLRGEAIPYTARIASIADAWDAMTSHRSYRRALSYEEALAEICQGAGSQFDPYLAKHFLNMGGKDKGLSLLKH